MLLETITLKITVPSNTPDEDLMEMDYEIVERLDEFINEFKRDYPELNIKVK